MKSLQRFKPSKAEQKAVNREINRQIAQSIEDLKSNFLALFLWQLHEQLGFGKNRLMQFYNGFKPAIDELQQYYDLYTGEDTDYMCKQKLKDLGIDVEQLPEVLPMEYEVK